MFPILELNSRTDVLEPMGPLYEKPINSILCRRKVEVTKSSIYPVAIEGVYNIRRVLKILKIIYLSRDKYVFALSCWL